MKRIAYILLFACLAESCTHYTFKDKVDWDTITIVITNRSSHELKVNFIGCDWISEEDTICIGPGNGLWQHEVSTDIIDNNWKYDLAMRMEVVGKDTLWLDAGYTSLGRYNPCSGSGDEGFISLNDHKGRYYVYSFSDKGYQSLCDSLQKMKRFRMDELCPSEIDLETIGNGSEAVFHRMYPTPATRARLKLGAMVRKEAASIDSLEFMEERSFEADSVSTEDTTYTLFWKGSPRHYIYGTDMLRKLSLAHLGADFATLSGRKNDIEMKKSGGVLYSHVVATRIESFSDRTPSDAVLAQMEEAVAVNSVIYGKAMYLLAEGNGSPYRVSEQMGIAFGNYHYEGTLIDDMDYHLFTLNADGEFQCQSGG